MLTGMIFGCSVCGAYLAPLSRAEAYAARCGQLPQELHTGGVWCSRCRRRTYPVLERLTVPEEAPVVSARSG